MKLPEHVLCTVSSFEEYEEMERTLLDQRFIGYDIETSGLRWWADDWVVGYGVGCFSKGKVYTWYLPRYEGEEIDEGLKYILENREISKIGANIRFDAHFTRKQGIDISPLEDIQVLARLLRTENTYKQVGLDKLMESEFGATHEEWEGLKKWGRANKIKINQQFIEPGAYAKVPVDLLSPYCQKDVYWTILLAIKYFRELKKDEKLFALYKSIERPLLPAIIDMEESGVTIDTEYLAEIDKDLEKRNAKYEKKVFDLSGKAFNIDSPQQLREVLKAAGIEPEMRRRKKSTGEVTESASFDATCLEKRASSPLVRNILEYRKGSKFRSTYSRNMLDRETEVIHASINQEAARTGRLSASDPNLTNIPRRDEEDEFSSKYSIRRAFIPHDSFSVLLAIDESQIEYRLLAHFSQDKSLIEAFKRGDDFHALVASELFGVPIEEVAKEQRYIGKTFNFAMIYGAGIEKLSWLSKLPQKKVKELLGLYSERFPAVREFKYDTEHYVRSHGYIRNPLGRIRIITPDKAYIGVNTLIQGTAADILKIVCIRVHKYLSDKRSKLLFPVHDELVINWDRRDGDIVCKIIKLMTEFKKGGKDIFRVPLQAEASICEKNWGDKKDVTAMDLVEAELYDVVKEDEVYWACKRDPDKKKWLEYYCNLLPTDDPSVMGKFLDWVVSIAKHHVPEEKVKEDMQWWFKQWELFGDEGGELPRMSWYATRKEERRVGSV